MSETKPIYSGEAVLLNWHDAKSGRKIVLQLEKYAPGAHPFDGLDGERFGVVIVGPLAPAEHEIPSPLDKRGVSAGGGVGRDGETRGSPTTPTKPKRRWQDMPASQRAALLTKDGEFQLFTSWVLALKDERASEAVANEFILTRCGVESKATLDTDKGERRFFRDQFDRIESEFEAFRQARGHGVI